jgi:hypothetical protein
MKTEKLKQQLHKGKNMYILLSKKINSLKDVKYFAVDSDEQFQSVLNFTKNKELMKFLFRVVRPDSMNLTEIKAGSILEAAGIKGRTVDNTQELDKILMSNPDKIFAKQKNNPTLERYIDIMFERYYKSLKYVLGLPFMGVTPNSVLDVINKEFTEHDFDGLNSCYSILSDSASEHIYKGLMTQIQSNENALI